MQGATLIPELDRRSVPATSNFPRRASIALGQQFTDVDRCSRNVG